jgi:sugar phosphate isomerase/epimerase
MKVVFFTKFLRGLDPQEILARVRGQGFDGLDLAVRAGHCVHPDNVEQALPRAMAVWRSGGLDVPLVSLETEPTDPRDARVRAIYAACGAVGIPFIKVGYWHWSPGQSYWDGVETARRALADLAELGARHGVCTLTHTHSGNCYGLNAASAMDLVQGLDPEAVGVYIDPAHLALNGEPLPMALDIVREYLRMVGVKNVRYAATGDASRWQRMLVPLGEGLVDWPAALRLLREAEYDGVLSVHGEYSASEDAETVLTLAGRDLAFLRAAL